MRSFFYVGMELLAHAPRLSTAWLFKFVLSGVFAISTKLRRSAHQPARPPGGAAQLQRGPTPACCGACTP